MVTTAELAPYYENILRDATIAELPNHYRGKVRDNYDLGDGRRIIIATDRLSAFDKILTAIPLKGQVLTQLARFWFDATRDICPNHVIEYPDPNVLVCRRLDIIPPTTKAFDGGHDEELNEAKIIAGGLLTAPQWREVCERAFALFERGREI